ncbi:MAG: hypothetical protein ACPGYV_11655 [Phycisphaeraceae bacterium]
MTLRRWRAYDLPYPEPLAEGLTDEEAQRFHEAGFWVEPMPRVGGYETDPEEVLNARARRVYERRLRINQRSGRDRIARRERREQAMQGGVA